MQLQKPNFDQYFCVSWVLRCMRWSYYSCIYKHKIDCRLEKKGIEAERKFEAILIQKDIKYRKGKNRKLYFKNFTLVGRPDFVTSSHVIEVKSGDKFLLQALAQLNLYMFMEGKRKGILVLYGNKRTKLIVVERSDFILRQSFAYFFKLAEHVINGVVPYPEKTFYCKRCYFKELCGF